MPDIFDRIEGKDTPKGDIFDNFPIQQQSTPEYLARTIGAAATGYANVTPYGLFTNLSNLIAMGDIYDPEEIERLKAISEREGIPFDEEKYLEAAENALGSFPTPSNIARFTEETTGLPITPKTGFQKGVETVFTAGRAQPGTLAQKGAAAITAPITSEVLQQAGVPEPFAELGGFAAGGLAGTKTPEIDIGKAKKPSGLTIRQYEKIKEPKKVSPGKKAQINEKVETEFRNISDRIIADSPVGETYSQLKSDPTFKETSRAAFAEVEQLAEEIPEILSTKEVKKEIVDTAIQKKGTGFLPSEYEKNHKKFLKQALQETPDQDITVADLVKQYRKNNVGFNELKEPGQSFAYNKAKRDALMDYNRAIANIFDKKFPNSEFTNLFKSTNSQWARISDAETINDFINEMFTGGIRFEKGRSFFDKHGMTMPFKRALGDDGFKHFEQLMKDLMSTEQANRMLKVAANQGFGDKASTFLSYIMHPKLGYAKAAYDIATTGFKKAVEAMLDKPQLAFTWENGVKAFKNGDFANADKAFKVLDAETAKMEKTKAKSPMKPKSEEIIDVTPKSEPRKLGEPAKLLKKNNQSG